MKVYAVMDVLEDCDGPVALYATRELAEAAVGSEHDRLRRQWQREADRAGQPIPRQGYKDGHGGIIPQVLGHPGPFEDWLRGRGARWVEELEVIES